MSKTYDKALQEWVREWKKENLSDEVVILIKQANYDLFYGPINDGAVGDPAEGDEELSKYPGFVTACKTIRDALDGLPSTIYIDTDCGQVSEKEPEPEKCGECQGEGGNGEICEACNGLGGFEPAGDWWKAERSDIRKVLLGTELAAHM